MAASNQLTSLANVKAWASVTTTSDDAILTRLIANVSRFLLSYLQRTTLFQSVFSEVYDGKGTSEQMLRNFPVLAVSSVTVDYQTIVPFVVPQQPTPYYNQYGTGFVLDPWDGYPPGRTQRVVLRGYRFCRGSSNVQIVYTSGFVVQNEAQTLPSNVYQVNPNVPNGPWAVDQGVTYASSGVALTAVSSNPITGQYVPPNPYAGTPILYYQFAAGDANQNILLNYSYVPADIEQACIDMVTERYSYRNRIGMVSKSLGGQESVSFSQKNMPDYISTLLQPYKRVVLV